MSGRGALLLVVIGVAVAFWAGERWKHNSVAAQNHRVAATREKEARDAKSAAFWAVIVPIVVLVSVLFVAARALGNNATPSHPSPRPTTHPASVRPPTPR